MRNVQLAMLVAAALAAGCVADRVFTKGRAPTKTLVVVADSVSAAASAVAQMP
jgi:hypothetical protein